MGKTSGGLNTVFVGSHRIMDKGNVENVTVSYRPMRCGRTHFWALLPGSLSTKGSQRLCVRLLRLVC